MNLNQVTVGVSDVERSIDFYEKLGLHLIVKSPHYARFECPDGEATFSIHLAESVTVKNGTTVYFEVTDVDATIKDLMKKGIPVMGMPEDKSWLWREALLHDPDENQIIIYFAGKNRKNPPWRIN